MEEFQRKHFKSFKYSLKKEKLEKKKPIRKKLIEAEPEETVVMYDASATNEAEEFDHDSEPIFHSWDVVQVINDDEWWHHVWTIWTIVRNNYYSNSNEDRIYVVNANWEDYNHSERFLSLMLEVDG